MSRKRERELSEEYRKVNSAVKALLSQWEYAYQLGNEDMEDEQASTSRELFYQTSAQFVRCVKNWKRKWPRLISENEDDKPELEDGSSSSSDEEEEEEEGRADNVHEDGVLVDEEPRPGKGKSKGDGPKKEKKPRKDYPLLIISKLGAFNTLETEVQHAYMGYAFAYALLNCISSTVNKTQISYANFFTSLVLNMGLVKSEVETIRQIGALLTLAINHKKHKSVKKGMITYVRALVLPSSSEDRNVLHESFKTKDTKTMLKICPHLAIFEHPAELMHLILNLYNEKHNLLAPSEEYDYKWTIGKDGPEFITSPPGHKSVFFDEVSAFKSPREDFPYEVSGDACTRDLNKLFPADKIALIDRFLEEPNAKSDAIARIIGGVIPVASSTAPEQTEGSQAPASETENDADPPAQQKAVIESTTPVQSRKRASSTSNGSKKPSKRTTIASSPPPTNQASSPPLSIPSTPAEGDWYTV